MKTASTEEKKRKTNLVYGSTQISGRSYRGNEDRKWGDRRCDHRTKKNKTRIAKTNKTKRRETQKDVGTLKSAGQEDPQAREMQMKKRRGKKRQKKRVAEWIQ